jgi:hypothetical protein
VYFALSAVVTASGLSAILDATPNRMRGQVMAVSFFLNVAIGGGFGPTAVALAGTHVFGEAAGLGPAISFTVVLSYMVAGLVLSRFAAVEEFWLLAAGGMVQVVFGAVLLVWSGVHYEELHGALRRGADVVHPSAVHWVGLATIAGTGAGLAAATVVTLTR